MICTPDSASERPAWTSVARATRVPSARAGRSSRSDISDVAYPVRAGSALWTAQPSGPSARIASVPTEISPCGLSSHRVAGIVNVALSGATSVSAIPVRWLTGGAGATPSASARSWSRPGRAAEDGDG